MSDQGNPADNTAKERPEINPPLEETPESGEGGVVPSPSSSYISSFETPNPTGGIGTQGTSYDTSSQIPEPPAGSTVVVPGGGGVPKWFYFIFGLTVLIFLIVTALLVMSLGQKNNQPAASAPTSSPTSLVPTKPILAPTTIPATDAAVLKLNTLGSSDEIIDLDREIRETDLTTIDQSLSGL